MIIDDKGIIVLSASQSDSVSHPSHNCLGYLLTLLVTELKNHHKAICTFAISNPLYTRSRSTRTATQYVPSKYLVVGRIGTDNS